MAKNVLGGDLESCSTEPMTGFYRDGCCNTGASDEGMHTICVEVTEDFLQYSKQQGNDLSTPNLHYDFPGLKDGDRWCLCILRWKQAYDAGMAPLVNLRATHISALEFVDLEILKEYATGDSLDDETSFDD